ncbi:hypothetical protein LTS18_008327 [Coniosporium uncinatum]|uniref:Uncharacterized protein n=1 Tax=Coniosporium uncinatum TaxID=93489 RepID=A0ACC3D1S7_9PEZI|nr:hypothetical protein LTS18_008327 [Coniosporium uncinatum]
MARYTRKTLLTTLSLLHLLILTALAAYALHLTRYYSLPIPTILSAFTLALPPVAGLALSSATSLRTLNTSRASLTRKNPQAAATWFYVTILVLIIYETAVAALAGTYFGPTGGLTCGLDEEWRRLFRNKDGNRIRQIQDAGECCGLHSPRDMAWPFPSKQVEAGSCAARYDRGDSSCFGFWREREQVAAGLMVLVVALVFVWMILVVTVPLDQGSWLSNYLPLSSEEDEAETGGVPRAIEYGDHNRYLDHPEAQEVADEAEDSARKAIENAERVSQGPELRVQPSQLMDGTREWRGDQREEA